MAQGDSTSNVKRDFGSFHASNVQDLLSIPKEDYIPPTLPVNLPTFHFPPESPFPFGKKAKKTYFFIEEECCFLNHGAFGSVLKPALATIQLWQQYIERQPLRFYDRQLLPMLVHVCRRLAEFIVCDPRDIVLINNATFGTNSVLKSIPFSPQDVILTFNITYGAVKKLVNHICTNTGAVNKEIVINFPVTGTQQILDQFAEEIKKTKPKLAVIDHIPSNAPILMPVKEMVKMCRERNILVLIDGAHSLGSLPLDISSIDPDFYVSNAHKWLCCPKGAAFLYVRRELQSLVRPAVVSHGLGSGFSSEFVWSGLHDYSPLLCLHTVLDFWLSVGPQVLQEYMHTLALDGAELLCNSWKTDLAAPKEMFGSMALVELPSNIHSVFQIIDYSAAESIQNQLYHDYNIEVPVKCVQGKLYVRISAHIHNDLHDFEKLAKAIMMISQGKGNKLL